MREIKFKIVWNGKMYTGTEWWGDCYTENGVVELPQEEDVIYLQFTGLKDKNGKEIYEGDIIQQDWSKPVEERNCGIVRYDEEECMFLIDYPSGGGSIMNHSTLKNEVIGNAYDSPELFD